ncbi:MAG: TonB-dependent receptor [Deltaproteobacteria bacterium]|nr:TonB-dependent receptor [Deltaproteobacteria bacterium]
MSRQCLAVLAAAVIFLASGDIWAQGQALDTILIEYQPDTIERITEIEMDRKAASNVWEALKGEPGVIMGFSGGRNEGQVTIRGSNRYQVGMYIDDVPVATAYRNEWDLNNSLLFDLESIEVSKGYSSPLLASNNGLAGVVNIRSYRPVKEIDVKAKYINNFNRGFSDQGHLAGLRIGTRQRLFYLQASIVEDRQRFFTLPHSFEPGRYEDGGRRENSDFKNQRLNFIAGITPTENIDVMFGYVYQDFEKGQPFDAAIAQYAYARFWRWPVYKTERYYINSDIRINEKASFKFLAYYDKHEDKSEDYDNTTLTNKGYTDKLYDQYTKGAQLRFDYQFNLANHLALSAGYRKLSHKDIQDLSVNPALGSYLAEEDVEDYWDFGAEYTVKPIEDLTLVLGLSYTKLTPKTNTRYANANAPGVELANIASLDKNLFNWQLGAFWDVTSDKQIFATIAKKGRMATMRERFWRNGDQPSNPFLEPEKAMHYEVGFRGLLTDWLETVASVYYTDYSDKIEMIGRGTSGHYENLNKTKIQGLDLTFRAEFSPAVQVGASLTWLNGKHEVDPRLASVTYLTETPKYFGALWAVLSPMDKLTVLPRIDFRGGYRTSDNLGDGGFVTADLKVTYDINDYLMVEAGAKNIFDALYTYGYYYPEQGRNFYLGLTAKY